MTLPVVPKQKTSKNSILLPFIIRYAFTNMTGIGTKKEGIENSQWKDELHLGAYINLMFWQAHFKM